MKKPDQQQVMKEAFAFREALVSFAYGVLRDWALAEDAVHNAFLVLMDKWREYDPAYGIFPWVRQMVFFKAKEIVRRRRRGTSVEDIELVDAVANALNAHFDEERAAEHRQRARALETCVDGLAAKARRILIGYYWDRKSCDELAGAIGQTANAVRITLSRMRKQLRQCVDTHLARGAAGS